MVPGVGASIRSANCTDWEKGTIDQRHSTVIKLRQFAGGPVGSSAGIQNGPVLTDERESANHACSIEVWLSTTSISSRMSRACRSAIRASRSASVP